MPSDLLDNIDNTSVEATELCRKPSGLLVSFQAAEVWLVACIGVFQAKDVFLRNYQVMDVLAVETWSNWKDTFQRTEARLEL